MPTARIRFTGVNAYVFGDDGLTVVTPNATRLGPSPQSVRPIPAHMLTIWQVGQTPQHYLWKSVQIQAFKNGKEITGLDRTNFDPILEKGNLLSIPKGALGGKIDPNLVSGRVHLNVGFASDETQGPCKGLAWSGPAAPASVDALVNRLVVEINDVDEIRITPSDLLKGGALPAPASFHLDAQVLTLFIGNVCSDDVLMRSCNDQSPVVDHDFEWMYALTNPPSLEGLQAPVVPQANESACGVKSSLSYEETQRSADAAFEGTGGGGLCGCQCIGCLAQPVGG